MLSYCPFSFFSKIQMSIRSVIFLNQTPERSVTFVILENQYSRYTQTNNFGDNMIRLITAYYDNFENGLFEYVLLALQKI